MLDVNLENVQYNNITKVRLPIDGTTGNYGEFYATNDADAQPEDVDSGKIFYNADGQQVGTGTMGGSGTIPSNLAAGPRIYSSSTLAVANCGNLYSNFIVRGTDNFLGPASNGDVRPITVINSTSNTCGSDLTKYKGVQCIDMGDGFILLLHSTTTNHQLTGTLILLTGTYGQTITVCKSVTICSTTGSGRHFCGVALKKRINDFANHSTNKAFVCYGKSNKMNGCIVTISKNSSTPTSSTITVSNETQINSAAYSGYVSMDCAIMSYTLNGSSDEWHILLAYGSGTGTSTIRPYVSNIKVLGTTISVLSNLQISSSLRISSEIADGNIRILRLSHDSFAGLLFSDYNYNLYTVLLYLNGNTIQQASNTLTNVNLTNSGVTFDVVCPHEQQYIRSSELFKSSFILYAIVNNNGNLFFVFIRFYNNSGTNALSGFSTDLYESMTGTNDYLFYPPFFLRTAYGNNSFTAVSNPTAPSGKPFLSTGYFENQYGVSYVRTRDQTKQSGKTYYTKAADYVAGNGTNPYPQRIKMLQASDIYLFHSTGSTGQICRSIQFQEECRDEFQLHIDDYYISSGTGAGNNGVYRHQLNTINSNNTIRKMDACLSSYNGCVFLAFCYDSGLKLAGTTVTYDFNKSLTGNIYIESKSGNYYQTRINRDPNGFTLD